MSVLIKGMEMPKGCISCFVEARWCPAIRKRLEKASRSDRWIPENYRHDDCPLIEVPEHGDLIDKQAMFNGEHNLYSWSEIEEQPTVIPADKDGET